MSNEVILTEAAAKAWDQASHGDRYDPDDTRIDKYDMPMCREMFNVHGHGGWGIDSRGNAVAFQVSGYPVMGDQPLSSAKYKWFLPEQP